MRQVRRGVSEPLALRLSVVREPAGHPDLVLADLGQRLGLDERRHLGEHGLRLVLAGIFEGQQPQVPVLVAAARPPGLGVDELEDVAAEQDRRDFLDRCQGRLAGAGRAGVGGAFVVVEEALGGLVGAHRLFLRAWLIWERT